jgi:hypothetical protein
MRKLLEIVCLMGGHRRSAGKARFDGYTFVSECRRCGRAMIKGEGEIWRTS